MDHNLKVFLYLTCRLFRETTYILRVWGVYFYCKFFRRSKRVKSFFYRDFKSSDRYFKIIKNDDYSVIKNHYIYWDDNRWFRFVQRPYHFFQPFSDKRKNYHFRPNCSLVSCVVNRNVDRLIVTNVSEKVYYEGITFEKVDFQNITLSEVAFHNCIFESCDFFGVKTKPAFETVTKELFSACEFNRTNFENAEFYNTVFSMCKFQNVTFKNIKFNDCIFHKGRFLAVIFGGNITMCNTHIFSPYRKFNISLEMPDAKVVLDPRCIITKTEDYIDSIENIEEFFDGRRNLLKTIDYKETKNTYQIFEWLYNENGLPWESDMYVNPYYQKKYAETRSYDRRIQRIQGYIAEKIIGYGEKPLNSLVTIALTIVLYGIAYMFSGYCIEGEIFKLSLLGISDFEWGTIFECFSKSLYFSFITLVTVGLGDISPYGIFSQVLMGSELFMGAILMTLFVSLLFRKMTK